MRRSKVEAYLHFVWATAERLPFIQPEVEARLYPVIRDEAERLGCEVLALGGIPDHVHLFLRLPATVSFSQLARQVKGVSSKFVSESFGITAFRWQEGYGVFSVSRSHAAKVCTYVQNQKQHHAQNRLWPEWEETDEEVTK